MVHEKEHDGHPPDDEQTEAEPEENETLDPTNDKPDESESYHHDEPKSGTNDDGQSGGKDDNEKSGSDLPKRGSRFRKKLLEKITPIAYSNATDDKGLAMESWLDTIINLKASDYLVSLQSIVSKKNL
jgi:hypothetical protein